MDIEVERIMFGWWAVYTTGKVKAGIVWAKSRQEALDEVRKRLPPPWDVGITGEKIHIFEEIYEN